MYQPTSAAPTSRLMAVGDFLLVALRMSPAVSDLAPELEAALDQLSYAASCTSTALRKTTHPRVAHRFAEQRLAVIVQPLVVEAAKLGVRPAPLLAGKAQRVASAEDLVTRVEVLAETGSVVAQHVAAVRKAVGEVKTQLRACEVAFENHDRVLAREIEVRERFVATYASIAERITKRVPLEVLRTAFFDDPTSRRTGARIEPATEASTVAVGPRLSIAA